MADVFIQVEADEPASEPLSLEEAGRQLRMSAGQLEAARDDIEEMVTATRQACETYTRRRLITQRVNWLPEHGFSCVDAWGRIWLPFANVTEIVSIAYIDQNGDTQSLDVATAIRSVLPTGEKCGRGFIEAAYGTTLPATRSISYPVTIRLAAGYGATGDAVPAALKRGMKALIGHMDRNREAVNVGNIVTDLPFGVKWSWRPFKTH